MLKRIDVKIVQYKNRHNFVVLETFWGIKKRMSPLLISGYLPQVSLDLLLGDPTYLPLLGDVVYEWSLTRQTFAKLSTHF